MGKGGSFLGLIGYQGCGDHYSGLDKQDSGLLFMTDLGTLLCTAGAFQHLEDFSFDIYVFLHDS